MTPLILNIHFTKEKSKIGYPQVSNWNLPDCYLTYSHKHYTMFNLQYDGESSNNSGDHVPPLNCASLLKTKRPEQHQSPTEKPTSICVIIYKHSTHTKLYHPAHCCVGLRRKNSRNKKWKSPPQQNRLTLMTNSRVIPHKSWMATCPSPCAPRFQLKQ